MTDPPVLAPRRRSNLLIKLLVAVGVLGGFWFLFMRSVDTTRSEPYTVDRIDLQRWSVTLDPAATGTDAMLVLKPGRQVVPRLFQQVFKRAMESLTTPPQTGIPLVLRSEFELAFAGRTTSDGLLAIARDTGLESVTVEPRCLAYRRISEPGSTRQLYFAAFDVPEFGRFRQALAALLDGAPSIGAFDPAALSAVLLVAGTDQNFSRWLPLRLDPAECIAPLVAN